MKGGDSTIMDQRSNNLTDKDIAHDILCGLKGIALGYHTASSEAASQSAWKTFSSNHDDVMKHQRKLWETMYSKGWYQVQGQANPNVEHTFGGGPTQRL